MINITRRSTNTNEKFKRQWDAELRNLEVASLHVEYRSNFFWGPPEKRVVTAGKEHERWVKESDERRRLEISVARLNNMGATWRMTILGRRQRTISCRSPDVGLQRLGIYKRRSLYLSATGIEDGLMPSMSSGLA